MTRRYERAMEVREGVPALAKHARGALIAGFVALFVLATVAQGMWVVSMIAAFAAFVLSMVQNEERSRFRHVEASPQGVSVEGDLVPAEKIAYAFRARRDGGDVVRLLGSSGEALLEVRVDGEEDARALLDALGRDVAHQRVLFEADAPIPVKLTGRGGTALVLAMVAAITYRTGATILAGLLGLVAVASAVAAVLPPTKVVVGADGVELSFWRRRRFVPCSEIARVEPTSTGARLRLASGETIDLSFQRTTTTEVELFVRRDALVERVRQVVEAGERDGARGATSADVRPLLARAGRTTEAWRRDLEALRSGREDYRAAPIRDEDLWSALDDPAAAPDVRAAAALLLRRSAGDEVGPRLRVASEAVASPKLRVALEAAATGDEAELDAALAEIARDDARR